MLNLELNKRTVRELSLDEVDQVAGAAITTNCPKDTATLTTLTTLTTVTVGTTTTTTTTTTSCTCPNNPK